jgi:uncharacterized protein
MAAEENTTEGKKKSVWLKLVEFHINRAYLMLTVIILGTLFFGYKMTDTKIHTDFFQLYPPNHPYIQLYKQYRDMFGTANVMSMVMEVQKGDIYNTETLTKVDQISKELLSTKGVNPLQFVSITHPKVKNIFVGAYGIAVLPLIPKIPETPEEFAALKKNIYRSEDVRGIFISGDNKSTLIQAGFWEEGVNMIELYKSLTSIKDRYEDANHKIYLTGYPMLYAWIAYYTPQLYSVFAVTAVILILMLWWYFRNIIGIVLPMLSMVISAIWGLGFVVTIGLTLDPLILVVPFLLSARALSHSVQSMERFYEEYAVAGDKRTAIVNAYGYLYKPGILGLITDALGVLTIAVATIPLIRNLAIYGSFWVCTIYFSSIVLHPVLLSMLPAPGVKKDRKNVKEFDKQKDREEIQKLSARPGDVAYVKMGEFFISLTVGQRKWIVFSTAMVILFVGGYMTHIYLKVGDVSAGKAILYPDHEYNIAYDKVNKEFLGASQMVVIAEGKKEKAMDNAESMRLLEEMQIGATSIPGVGGSVSIADIIKRVSRMWHETDPKWGMLPEEVKDLSQMIFLIGGNMGPGELDRFISTPDYTNATVTLFFRDYNNQTIKGAISYLKDYIAANPAQEIRFRLVGGILGIIAAVNEEVEWSYWINMMLIFSTIFLFCWWTYRTWLGALVLWVPLVVCQILCDIIMLIFGIDLNINSLPVASVGVGVGVDYGIYILSRLAEEYQFSKGDFVKANYMAITSTGKAIIFTASTLIVSIILFAFSSFKFQAEMAILLSFLLVANMVGALVLMPALVSIIGPERILPKYRV